MIKKRITATLLLLTTLVIGAIILLKSEEKQVQAPVIKETNMKIESPAFGDNKRIPSRYTCDGEDVNPGLFMADIPAGTQSLALIMDDPDAPGGTWIHWTMWNIPPATTEIGENSVPDGAVEGMTSFGRTGYGGPCPPSGTHRYFFKVYALDIRLDIPSSADKAKLEKAIAGHILEQAQLVGLYSRR